MLRRTLSGGLLVLFSLLAAACGGGGGSGSSTLSAAPVTYSKAIIKVGLTGTLPPGTAISGASFSLSLLQPDLAIPTTAGAVDTGVVTPSGTFLGAIQTTPQFTPAVSPVKFGNLMINLADTTAAGVTQVGEIATITVSLPNHAAPPPGSYVLLPYGVVDLSGNPIPTLHIFISDVILQ